MGDWRGREMTNKEAKGHLKKIGYTDEIRLKHPEIEEALNMAIKALEQEPKFIAKADGTIEQIKNCDDCLFKKEWEKIGKLISVVLEKQTEQAPKTGHWIIEKWNNKEHYSCSSCQHVVDYEPCYHYCPYCGAKMVEPQESEEE